MARIRSRDTKPELIVRSVLHRAGIRFSLRRKDLPGKPDIVLPKYQTVILVHGCFWHRHPGCSVATTPKSNIEFWHKKFDTNVKRDRRNQRALRRLGWKVIVVWECQIMKNPFAVLKRILREINYTNNELDYTKLPPRKSLLSVAEERLHYNLRE